MNQQLWEAYFNLMLDPEEFKKLVGPEGVRGIQAWYNFWNTPRGALVLLWIYFVVGNIGGWLLWDVTGLSVHFS